MKKYIFFIIPVVIIIQGCTSAKLLETHSNIMKSLDKMDSLNKEIVESRLVNKKQDGRFPFKLKSQVSYTKVFEKYKYDEIDYLPLDNKVLGFVSKQHVKWKYKNIARKDNISKIIEYNKNFSIMLEKLKDFYNSKSFKSHPSNEPAIYKPAFNGVFAPNGRSYSPLIHVKNSFYHPKNVLGTRSASGMKHLKMIADYLKKERSYLINKTKEIERKENIVNKEVKRMRKELSMIVNKKNSYIKIKKIRDIKEKELRKKIQMEKLKIEEKELKRKKVKELYKKTQIEKLKREKEERKLRKIKLEEEKVYKTKLDIDRAINFYENTGDALLFLGMIKHISNEGGYLPNPYGSVAKILKFVKKTSRLHYPGRRRNDIYGTVYKDELVVAYPFNGRTHVFPLDYPKVLANALINNTRINTDNLSASTTVGGKASEIDYSDYGNYEKITKPSIEQRRLGISIDNNNGNHSDIESTLNRGFSGSIYDTYNTIQDGLDALEPLFRKKKR